MRIRSPILCLCLLFVLFVGVAPVSKAQESQTEPEANARSQAEAEEDRLASVRARMVQRHLAEREIEDERVLEAFRAVPRHRFVPDPYRRLAYEDEAILIGEGQTITTPFEVAFMTQILQPKPTDKVYEVGTGSGYQAAILGQLVDQVYSVEIHEPLGKRAAQVIEELGYQNINTRVGDGYLGWPEAAPFDKIIVTCAPEAIPPPLIEQLKEGGRIVVPLGTRFDQKVYVFDKKDGELVGEAVRPTLYVPMTGQAQREAAERRAQSEAEGEKPEGSQP